MPTYLYPTNEDLMLVAQDKLPVLTQADPIFDHFPIVDKDADVVMWEQLDNYTGLQQVRGIDGKPPSVLKTAARRYLMEPGVYGEFELLDEKELTSRRRLGNLSSGIDISDLVMMSQDKLMSRRIDRIRWILWTLASTGQFAVALATGGIAHTDVYSLQQYSGSAWSSPTTGTPLQDIRGVKLLARGHSLRFDAKSTAYMNQRTFNKLTANTNPADFGGKRTQGLATIIGLAETNYVLLNEDLPQIVIYDDGYLNDSGTFVPFIADNTTVIVGRRLDGSPIGSYCQTRNVNNPDAAPGAYMKVVDDENEVPRQIAVHDGHNGGPTIAFPSAIVILSNS